MWVATRLRGHNGMVDRRFIQNREGSWGLQIHWFPLEIGWINLYRLGQEMVDDCGITKFGNKQGCDHQWWCMEMSTESPQMQTPWVLSQPSRSKPCWLGIVISMSGIQIQRRSIIASLSQVVVKTSCCTPTRRHQAPACLGCLQEFRPLWPTNIFIYLESLLDKDGVVALLSNSARVASEF